MKATTRPAVSVRGGVVKSGVYCNRTGWGAIVTSPLSGPASVQLVFADPEADLRRTLRQVTWRAYYSWALAVAVLCSTFLFLPVPGGLWRRLVFAYGAGTVVYLAARLLGRLRRSHPWWTISFQLTPRRSFAAAASEVTFVLPTGISEFASVLDRAAGIYSAGLLRKQAGTRSGVTSGPTWSKPAGPRSWWV
jgi:hypothetical protein